jgi:hypothetical protein
VKSCTQKSGEALRLYILHWSIIQNSAENVSDKRAIDAFGLGDVAHPMLDSAYYAIPGYVVADNVKTKFLFLFLPRKEKIKEAIGVQYWWSILSSTESGWGPPTGVLKMGAHQQKSPFYFSSVVLVFGLGNSCPSC